MHWGREQCVLHCALLSMKKYAYRPVPSKTKKCRPFPSWEKLYTVPSRCEKLCAPSRPVDQKYMYRPVPLLFWFTGPSRRAYFYLQSRPVMKQKGRCTLPSCSVEELHTHRPVPSHPGNCAFIFFPSRPVPSSIFFPPNMSKQYRPVPSRILPAMKILGKINYEL